MKALFFAFFAISSSFSASFPMSLPTSTDSCAKTCAIHAECGIGGVCEKGQCHYASHFCFNERWSVNDRLESTNCDGYACSIETGFCLREAKSSQDCLSGYVFDRKSACIPSVQCDVTDPACQDLFDRWKRARTEYEASTPSPQLPLLNCVSCSENSPCESGKMCWQGRCEEKKPFCHISNEGEHAVAQVDGAFKSCGNYICEPVASQCLSQCLKNSDCRSGKVCISGACL